MKQARLLGDTASGNTGFSERPNYLSSVIHGYSTSVLSHSSMLNKRGEQDMTFDLDNISKFLLI